PVLRPFRHVVLLLAGLCAQTAPDASVDVDGHRPFVLGRVVTFGRTRGNEYMLHRRLGRPGERRCHNTGHGRAQFPKQIATRVSRLGFHGVSFGEWGTWHSVHLGPKWVLITICLCHLGREGLASWQRVQALKRIPILTSGLSAWAWPGPWQPSHERPLCSCWSSFLTTSEWHSSQAFFPAKTRSRVAISASASPRYQPYSRN